MSSQVKTAKVCQGLVSTSGNEEKLGGAVRHRMSAFGGSWVEVTSVATYR